MVAYKYVVSAVCDGVYCNLRTNMYGEQTEKSSAAEEKTMGYGQKPGPSHIGTPIDPVG
jgi:hypothetical protein